MGGVVKKNPRETAVLRWFEGCFRRVIARKEQ